MIPDFNITKLRWNIVADVIVDWVVALPCNELKNLRLSPMIQIAITKLLVNPIGIMNLGFIGHEYLFSTLKEAKSSVPMPLQGKKYCIDVSIQLNQQFKKSLLF